MDKRESEAREVLARVLSDGGFPNEAADIRNGLDVQMCDGWVVRAMLAFVDSRPAADLEAVREAILNRLLPYEESVADRRYNAGLRDAVETIRFLDLSALSGAGEG